MSVKIDWLKCQHGHELRFGKCPKCEEDKNKLFSHVIKNKLNEAPKKIPIKRGCNNKDGCFCNGSCQEIIGYREPLFVGERV